MGKERVLPSENKPLYTPNYRVLEIAGWAGTGTTTTALELSKQHGAKFVCVGDIFKYVTGPKGIPRNEALDKKFNSLGKILIKNAYRTENPRTPLIVDSRLGAIFALQAEQANPNFRIPKIKLIATHEKSAQRIAERDGMSLTDARAKTEERNRKDAEIFKELLEINPETSNEVLDNNIFDLILDTTKKTIEQNVIEINKWLLERGLIV